VPSADSTPKKCHDLRLDVPLLQSPVIVVIVAAALSGLPIDGEHALDRRRQQRGGRPFPDTSPRATPTLVSPSSR